MSRIDVQTLVLAFEKRIEALEKNPPDKISTSVIVNLLEKAIEDEIKNHFRELVRREIVKQVKKEFSDMRDEFVKKTINSLLTDDAFQKSIENSLKYRIMKGFGEDN